MSAAERVRRIVELHALLFCAWQESIEPGDLQGRIAAVARREYFEAALLQDPAADVDALRCPERLVPTWGDLFPLGAGWRPSEAADAESFRLAAQWREASEYGTSEPHRDPLGPVVAEWQARA